VTEKEIPTHQMPPKKELLERGDIIGKPADGIVKLSDKTTCPHLPNYKTVQSPSLNGIFYQVKILKI
jgi:hypothetical protein